MNKVWNRLAMVALVSSAAGLTACQDQVGLDASASTSLSFAATGGKTLLGDPTPPQNPMTISGHVIQINSVEMRLSKIELKGANELETEIRGSTMVVGVPGDGGLVTPVTANIAAGTFNELEMRVQTVRVQGTFDGQAFDVTALVDKNFETVLSPALEVTQSGATNITVTLNISNWFRAADGSALDVRSANATVLASLAANIESSFEAFEDHDRSGHENSGSDDGLFHT